VHPVQRDLEEVSARVMDDDTSLVTAHFLVKSEKAGRCYERKVLQQTVTPERNESNRKERNAFWDSIDTSFPSNSLR
jgi:hypothetical protein